MSQWLSSIQLLLISFGKFNLFIIFTMVFIFKFFHWSNDFVLIIDLGFGVIGSESCKVTGVWWYDEWFVDPNNGEGKDEIFWNLVGQSSFWRLFLFSTVLNYFFLNEKLMNKIKYFQTWKFKSSLSNDC